MLSRFWRNFKRLWFMPEMLDHLEELLMTSAQNAQSSADDLQRKIDLVGKAVAGVATVVNEARAKIAAQASAIEDLRNGTVDPDTLAAINASVDSSLDQLARLITPVVSDPSVDTGDVDVPPATNPATPAPETVPIPEDAPEVVTEPSAVDTPPATGGDANTPVAEGGSDAPAADPAPAPAPEPAADPGPAVDNPSSPPPVTPEPEPMETDPANPNGEEQVPVNPVETPGTTETAPGSESVPDTSAPATTESTDGTTTFPTA